MRRALFVLCLAFSLSFCCACNAVTPGPSTTRKNSVTVPTSAAAETQEAKEETTAAAETEAVTETAAEEVSEESKAASGHIMYTTAGINVRDGASTDSEIVGTLEEDEEVTVIGEEGSWSIIEFEGGKYYCASKYLTDEEP